VFSSLYNDVNWWRKLHDYGHFNCVRAMAFLGNWYSTGNMMDVRVIEGILDKYVSNAARTGMYVIIDEHSADGVGSFPTDWNQTATFWSAVAPRYANDTNVIYELKNEPDPEKRQAPRTRE